MVSNNSYILREISQREAQELPNARFFEEEIYIPEKTETEPARTYQTIFGDNEGRFFELKVSVPTVETAELQTSIIFSIIILISILLTVLMLINYFVFRREMKPLYSLLRWFRNYTIGQKDAQTPETQTNITEFQQLYEAVSSGVKKNEEIFEQQKQFISNASHELQTPLSVCKNRLEMLLDSENMPENKLADITEIENQIEKIIKLNKTLLFLSKIDNQQFVDKQQIKFNEAIKTLATDFCDIYAHKNIDFQIEDNGIFQLSMNETLVHSLISNLLKNAFVHTAENGKIFVKTYNDKVIFQNSGNSPLNKDLIFNRFYTSGNRENSSGLGLAIVESICKNYYLQIDYEFVNDAHIFTVKKP
ncbi:MAG: HAMP domain-containing histidine kinase [Bacteroidales bacterium]|nr:HAMP domain-containing histidine kinase [Bacteroidales bacterium]